jgi:16S rRNA (guanine527-N7)-methyltransferase
MENPDHETRLDDGIDALGLDLPAVASERLLAYLRLLDRWNRTYNLTAVRSLDDMVTRHVLDSLAVAPLIAGDRCLDVGSGAGLPGIPLALAAPGRHWTLLDASGKRVRFLRHVVSRLGVGNVTCVQSRVEDYEPATPFDTVLSRAFAGLPEFLVAAGRHCAPAGRMMAMKGRLPEDELGALPASWRLTGLHQLRVPGLEGTRHLAVLARSMDEGTAREADTP